MEYVSANSLTAEDRETNKMQTNLTFIIKLLSQHVSDIIIPIISWTSVCTAACGVLHWLCWLWLCVAGTRTECTVLFQSALCKFHSALCTFKVHFAISQCHVHLHSAHSSPSSYTQPQSAQQVQDTTCGTAHACSPGDGHNDVRNMLWQKFENEQEITCNFLVSLSSTYVHDSWSKEPKISLTAVALY